MSYKYILILNEFINKAENEDSQMYSLHSLGDQVIEEENEEDDDEMHHEYEFE